MTMALLRDRDAPRRGETDEVPPSIEQALNEVIDVATRGPLSGSPHEGNQRPAIEAATVKLSRAVEGRCGLVLRRAQLAEARAVAAEAARARSHTEDLGKHRPDEFANWPCCDQPAGEGCTVPNVETIDGAMSKRAHGAEAPARSDRPRYMPTAPCADCAAPVGARHHAGCILEECPRCHRRLAVCGCAV
jgi:hypothetical protein